MKRLLTITAIIFFAISFFPQSTLLFQNEIKYENLQTELAFISKGNSLGEILIGSNAFQVIPNSEFLKSIPVVQKYSGSSYSTLNWSAVDTISSSGPRSIDFFKSLFYNEAENSFWWVTDKNEFVSPKFTLFKIDQNGALTFVKDIDYERNGSWNNNFIATSPDFGSGIIEKHTFNLLNSQGNLVSSFDYNSFNSIIISHEFLIRENNIYLVLKNISYRDTASIPQLSVLKYDLSNNIWGLVTELHDTLDASFVHTSFDASGNLYLAYRHSGDSTINVSVYKINSETGEEIWHKEISSLFWQDVDGISISDQLGLLVLQGDYEFSDGDETHSRGYFSGIKLENGDEVFTQEFNFGVTNKPDLFTYLRSAFFTEDNKFILGGVIHYYEGLEFIVKSYIAAFDLSGVTTVKNDATPQKFSLSQNYPNPFNPTTSIQYEISNKEFVSLKVYDVLGNEIATLVNEEKSPGNYEVEFSAGSLADGGGLSSGMFFYTISAGNFSETRKMMLLK